MTNTFGPIGHRTMALDDSLLQKISKHHFFQGIKNSFHEVIQIGVEQYQNFSIFFSTSVVARGFQSFCILEGATDPPIEQ